MTEYLYDLSIERKNTELVKEEYSFFSKYYHQMQSAIVHQAPQPFVFIRPFSYGQEYTLSTFVTPYGIYLGLINQDATHIERHADFDAIKYSSLYTHKSA